eukprot:s1629_g5.t1
MSLCNKCKQEPGHLGDSWCLSCSAAEAISGELRSNWGGSGACQVAAGILSSSVRQIRALRRLGVAAAGSGRASRESAGASRASSAKPGGVPEPEGPPPHVETPMEASREDTKVKEEEKDQHGGSDAEEEEESEEEEDQEIALTAAPKRKVSNEDRSPVPRRRVPEVPEPPLPPHRHTSRDRSRERSPRRDRSRDRRERRSEREEHRAGADRSRRRSGEEETTKKKKKKKGKPHRAGAKHQRLGRAETNPFQRLHYKKLGSFWDQDPSHR